MLLALSAFFLYLISNHSIFLYFLADWFRFHTLAPFEWVDIEQTASRPVSNIQPEPVPHVICNRMPRSDAIPLAFIPHNVMYAWLYNKSIYPSDSRSLIPPFAGNNPGYSCAYRFEFTAFPSLLAPSLSKVEHVTRERPDPNWNERDILMLFSMVAIATIYEID